MWVSKKTLADIAQRNLEQQELLRSQYQARIAQLEAEIKYQDQLNAQYRDQIEDLRSLVFPKVVTAPTAEAREFDAVISGSEKPPEVSEADQTAMLEGLRERDLILSGDHENELLN